MGMFMIVDVVMGGGGVGQALATYAINVAALRYDRDAEAEADRLGLAYLDGAGLDPGGMAKFFDLIREEAEQGFSLPELISTHPETKARADAARALSKPGRPPALDDVEWRAVKMLCGMQPDDQSGDDDAPPPVVTEFERLPSGDPLPPVAPTSTGATP
jgi:predicted Zn-dependent protease